MKRTYTLISILIYGLVIGGCASGGSTSSKSSQSKAAANALKAADVNVQLAIRYLADGRVELALEKIDRALSQDPKSATAQSVAGIINERIGRMDVAEQQYAQSVKLAPENGDLLNNYGQFLCKKGDVDAAMEHFTRAIEQPFYETPEVALGNACFCFYKAKRFEQAEKVCRQAIATDEKYGDPYYLLSVMFLAHDEPFKARAFLQRYESVAPDTPTSLMLCIDIETAMKSDEGISDCQQRLINNFPDSNEAREIEGRLGDERAVN